MGLEGTFTYTPTQQKDDVGLQIGTGEFPLSNPEQKLMFFTGSFLFYPGSNPVFEPYLAIGAGGRVLSKADILGGWADNTMDLTVGIGGGLRFHYNDQLSIRIDVRDWISSFDWFEDDPESSNELQNDIILTTGFSVVVGGN